MHINPRLLSTLATGVICLVIGLVIGHGLRPATPTPAPATPPISPAGQQPVIAEIPPARPLVKVTPDSEASTGGPTGDVAVGALENPPLAPAASIVEEFDAAGQKCAALRAVVSKAALTDLPVLMARTLLFEKGHARTHLSEVIIGLWAADAPAAAMDCAYRPAAAS
jgi:hypothetical protein